MADHALPAVSSNYTAFVDQLRGRIDDVAKGFDVADATNIPAGSIKWDSQAKNWKIYAENNWNTQLSTLYNININGTVGATAPAAGAFTTLSTTGVAALAANSTVGGAAIVAVSGAQTLVNKTLTAPIISTISNTGTITLPTATTTLVGTDTTDTLTNKTLTAPKIANGDSIVAAGAFGGGEVILTFGSTSNSSSNIKISNGVLGVSPTISTIGTSGSISLDLAPKGTGIVTIKGIAAVDISSAQTLTNKTIGASSSYTGNTIAVGHGGTGATTFTSGGLLKGNGTGAVSTATAAEILTAVGTVPVASGGTGAVSFTANALLKGNGTAAVSAATSAEIVTAIGTTAVANATNAANSTNATKLVTAAFSIEEVGGKLVFKNGTTVIATLTAAGLFSTLDDVAAFAAPL